MVPQRKRPEQPSTPSPLPWRLSLAGEEHRGEVIVADRWEGRLGLRPEDKAVEFRLVLLNTPSRLRADSIKDSRVAVWLPSQALAETSATYLEESVEKRLSRLLASSAFSQGRIYVSQGLAFPTASQLVGRSRGRAVLDTLGLFILLHRSHPYLQTLYPDLPSMMDLSTLETNLPIFQESQARLRQQVQATKAAVEGLSQRLLSPLSAEDEEVLINLQRLAEIQSPGLFSGLAEETFGSPVAFASALDYFRRLRQLAEFSPEIRAVADYLQGVSLKPGNDELSVDLMSIREQLRMADLAARPHLWSSVQDMFQWFRAQYAPVYLEHHRRFQQEARELHSALLGVASQVKAIAKLNTIPDLQAPEPCVLGSRYKGMLARSRPCRAKDLTISDLEHHPTCPHCHLPLSTLPPTTGTREYLDQLHRTLQEQCRKLSRVTTRRILRTDNDRLDKLIRIVQVSDLAALANVLDDELVALLRDLIREPPP